MAIQTDRIVPGSPGLPVIGVAGLRQDAEERRVERLARTDTTRAHRYGFLPLPDAKGDSGTLRAVEADAMRSTELVFRRGWTRRPRAWVRTIDALPEVEGLRDRSRQRIEGRRGTDRTAVSVAGLGG